MRTIWYITGLVAVSAAVVLAVRTMEGPNGQPTHSPSQTPSSDIPVQTDPAQIDTMLTLLREDPRTRRTETREAVERAAVLAEQGIVVSAETLYALGLRLHGQGQLADSEKAFRKAIELRPEWSWTYNNLGIVLHAQDKYEDAEKAFRQAIALDPEWSRPHNDLAILLRKAGSMEEAEHEARLACKLAPNSVATHNNYGNLLVILKRFDEAERAYLKAIELDPDHPAPYYNFACLNSLRNRVDEAIELLKQAVGLDEAFRQEARTDKDFDPIREDPRFTQLVEGETVTPGQSVAPDNVPRTD